MLVVQPEQQRADQSLPALVPAEAGDHAIRRARVLHLDHRALAGLIGAVRGLRDHAIEARALERVEPLAAVRDRPSSA